MSEVIIKNINQQNHQIELTLSFPKDAHFFQGHFPEKAILPGFVQVHFAMNFAKEFLQASENLSNIKKLKFSKVISPEMDVILLLEKIENGKISFKYKDSQHIYSSGEFHNA